MLEILSKTRLTFIGIESNQFEAAHEEYSAVRERKEGDEIFRNRFTELGKRVEK